MNLCLGCMTKIAEDDIFCPFCGHTIGMTAEHALKEGTILENRYIVGKMLSNNSLLTTYLGWDAEEERKMIIKEFFPRSYSDRSNAGEIVVSQKNSERYINALTCFAKEYEMQQRFSGMGCLADVEAVIKLNNTIYAVIEFIEGTTLEDTFLQHTVTFDSAKTLVTEVAKTLAPLHKAGVTHCNITPSNIIVTTSGRVKLMDFGSAKYQLGLTRGELAEVQNTGFAPPELFEKQPVGTPKTDVYSIAAVLYKMLTGITPPPAMQRFENDTLIAPSSVSGVKIDRGAENAILNALEVSPARRTESVDAFLTELNNPLTPRLKPIKEKCGARVPLFLKIAAPILGIALIAGIAYLASAFKPLTNPSSSVNRGQFQVPNLINKTEAEALKEAEGLWFFSEPSFSINIIGREYSENVEAGKILSQTPEDGVVVNKGIVIKVTMSGGAPEPTPDPNDTTIKMPFVLYTGEADARKTLEDMGMSVEVQYEQSSTAAKGLVIKQSVENDKEIKKGDKITLTVSSGPPPTSKKNTQKQTTQPKKNNGGTAPKTQPAGQPTQQPVQQQPAGQPAQQPAQQPAGQPAQSSSTLSPATPMPTYNPITDVKDIYTKK